MPSRCLPIVPRRLAVACAAASLLGSVLSTALAWTDAGAPVAGEQLLAESDAETSAHLVVSEVTTGGSSASDEFIEVYNPGIEPLPLEGLEVVYVTATGATVTRKASWPAGASSLAPGAHLLIANEAGMYAAAADATYANGLAATGGSVAIRIIGASTAIDAVGWGTADNGWLEGTPAPAHAAGRSLERLPGGAAGSGQDSGDNAVDFIEREVPEPQNTGAPPVPTTTPAPSPSESGAPSPTPDPTPAPTAPSSAVPTPSLSPSATPSPTATFTPAILSVAQARALPDDSIATVEAVSLTDGTFTEGGGYVADATGGIAVLVADGSFPRGTILRITGTLDDRFSQRTLRTVAAGIVDLGSGTDPSAPAISTGAVAESWEGLLVEVAGRISGAPTSLSGGLAYELDDGSGPVRVLVGSATGIDTSAWLRDATVQLRGVVGQRDSTGTGTAGYRVQPRDSADILVAHQATPTPGGSPSPGPGGEGSPTPTPSFDPSVVSIATARAAAVNTRLAVRGVVTLPSGISEPGSAVIQDSSAAILLRLGDDVGDVRTGELLQLNGVRSTKSGMESLRVSEPPLRLGSAAGPIAERHATGALGEPQEALLVVIRGAVVTSPRRTSAENVYFSVDDGSGALQVFLSPRSGIDADEVAAGAWIDVVGVLMQETTGRQPERGYRLWPRTAADLRIVAAPAGTGGDTGAGAGSRAGSGGQPGASAGPIDAGGGGITPGRRPEGGPSLPQPRLALALPTSPPPAPVETSRLAAGAPEPELPAAGLLLAGGLGLVGSGWLVLTPATAGRLVAAVRRRAGTDARERDADGEPAALVDEREGPSGEMEGGRDLHAGASFGAALLPLTVVEGAGRGSPAQPSVRERDSERDRGRILPPT